MESTALPRLLAAALSLLGAASCGTGNLAGGVVNPPAYERAGQTKCGVVKNRAKPLVIEWPAADRQALQAQMQKGLVAVRFDGCQLEVQRRCKGPGKYTYSATTRQDERVLIASADELFAQMPLDAVKLEGRLANGGQIVVAMSMIGAYEAENPEIAYVDLAGTCDQATHVVTALTAGAFELSADSSAEKSAGVTVLGAGAGAKSEQKRQSLDKGGDALRCDKATRRDTEPPDGCDAPLRIELAPIAGAVPHPSAETPKPADGKAASDLDEDGDGVSNMLDVCPMVAGPVEGHGCPR
jgi:hypothetical protein